MKLSQESVVKLLIETLNEFSVYVKKSFEVFIEVFIESTKIYMFIIHILASERQMPQELDRLLHKDTIVQTFLQQIIIKNNIFKHKCWKRCVIMNTDQVFCWQAVTTSV